MSTSTMSTVGQFDTPLPLLLLCWSADIHSIQRSIVNHVEYTLACTRFSFDNNKAYRATAHRCGKWQPSTLVGISNCMK